MSQKPTAAQILHSWDETQKVFRKTTAWLALLRIAAAGPKGISVSELRRKHFDSPDRRTLEKYEEAGLLLTLYRADATNHRYPCYVITQRGSRFLRIAHHATPTPQPLTH